MTASFNPRVFREYDIRGHAERDLATPFVRDLGLAYGTYVRRAGARAVALGRDCRVSGPRLFEAFVGGVRSAGVDVVDIGVVPTPVLYWALFHLPVDGGVIVTGSHNPGDENGFKLCLGRTSIFGAELQALRALVEAQDFERGEGALSARDIVPAYLDDLAARLVPARPLKVVVDAGNGMGGLTAGALYRRLGHEVIELYCALDGTFPNHHPDPAHPENLEDLARRLAETDAEIGLAFDGDGDRLGVVTKSGKIIWPDRQLMLYAKDVLAAHPGGQIIYDVKCTRNLAGWVRDHGGVPLMWRTGHSLIKAKLKETGAPLAGEMSGHVFFNDRWYGFDDGLYTGARLLEILSRSANPSAVLEALPDAIACQDNIAS